MQFEQEAQIPGRPRKRVLARPALDGLEPRLVAAPSLHEQTTARLRDLIVEGDFAPGQRLVEIDLCERLRVSRTPLREALKVLAGEHLVELQPNRGATVTRINATETMDLFTVVAELESLAAELSCNRMTASERHRLALMHAEMIACHQRGDRHGYFELNGRIHRAVVVLSRNATLSATHERLMVQARRARYQALLTTGRWEQSIAEHEALMAAFASRSSARARRIWREHVRSTGERVAGSLAGADAIQVEQEVG